MRRGSFSYIIGTAIVIAILSISIYLLIIVSEADDYKALDEDVERLMKIFILLHCLGINGEIEQIGIYNIEYINSTVIRVEPEGVPGIEYIIYLNRSNLSCEYLLN